MILHDRVVPSLALQQKMILPISRLMAAPPTILQRLRCQYCAICRSERGVIEMDQTILVDRVRNRSSEDCCEGYV